MLETDALTLMEAAKVSLRTTNATASFDNVQYITNDPAMQTMAYNGANELTSSVVGVITTTYTYDAHGRTISKADGTHSARFIWFAGEKLKQCPALAGIQIQNPLKYDQKCPMPIDWCQAPRGRSNGK